MIYVVDWMLIVLSVVGGMLGNLYVKYDEKNMI